VTSERLFPTIDVGAVPWLSVEQMREVDRIMVEELGISLVRMMENAGRSLAQVARDLIGGDTGGRSIVVLAGPGGNGGGGLVAARHLAGAGAQVAVVLSAPAERFASVPAEQLAIAQRLGITNEYGSGEVLGEPALVIDSLLGYGQRGDPHGEAARLISWSAGRRVLALDVPSGLELASGQLRTPHVRAEATMTLAAPKTALAAAGATGAVGRLFLADISVPALVYERLGLSYETPFTRRPVVELGGARSRG
jgi:NAD(P)H-hydrate epimerase